MNNETTQKQVWQTPEIIDLDVVKTASGHFAVLETGGTYGSKAS